MNTRQLMTGVAACALALTACSSELTREDAIENLMDEGIAEETAICVMDDLEAQGIEAKDVEDSVITEETEVLVATAFSTCATGEDIGALLSPEEIKESFVGGLTSSGDIDEAQGNCIYDFLVDEGVTTQQLTENSFDQELVTSAVSSCL